MSIVDNLNLIKTYKIDIKNAIINKGVDMEGISLSGYAEKIGDIKVGGELQEKTVLVNKTSIVVIDSEEKHYDQNGRYSIDELFHGDIVVDVPEPSVFEGTQSQWDAMTDTQKSSYDTAYIIS